MQSFDSRIISQIDKEHRAVNVPDLPEVIHEEFGFFKGRNPAAAKTAAKFSSELSTVA